MKKTIRGILPLLLVANLLAVTARAEDEPKPEAEPKPPPDGVKLLSQLTKANAEKDVGRLELILKSIRDLAVSSKDQELLDQIAKELTKSFKLAKGNFGTQRSIIDTMGELRSKKCLSSLKKVAFKKKTKSVEEEALQAQALLAVGKYRDSKLIGPLEDASKNRSITVAKAAYEAFGQYGSSPGKVRKQVAELLMKRLDSEYPTASSGGNISAAAQERWGKLQEIIVKSLQSVCHETTIIDIENWREWWKENKRNSKRWKDPKKAP
jgi:hypothetical protein